MFKHLYCRELWSYAVRKMCVVLPRSWQMRCSALLLHTSRLALNMIFSCYVRSCSNHLKGKSGAVAPVSFRRQTTRRRLRLSLHPSTKGRSCPPRPQTISWRQRAMLLSLLIPIKQALEICLSTCTKPCKNNAYFMA